MTVKGKLKGYIFAGLDFNDCLLRELFDWQLQMKKYQVFFLFICWLACC